MDQTNSLLGMAPDQYDQQIQDLIRVISQPDQPEQIPSTPRPRTTGGRIAQTGVAALADALTALGYSKGGRIPPSNFLGTVTAENYQRRAANQENARRIRQAQIEGTKTGAGLRLRDIQDQRRESANNADRAAIISERDRKDALDYAQSLGVPVVDESGKVKDVAKLRADSDVAAAAKKKAKADYYAQRTADHQKNYELALARLEVYKKHAARTGGGGGTPEDKALAKKYDEQIQTLRGQLSTLNQRRATAVNNYEDAQVSQLDGEIASALDRLNGAIDARYTAMTTAPSPAAPAASGDGWGSVVKH